MENMRNRCLTLLVSLVVASPASAAPAMSIASSSTLVSSDSLHSNGACQEGATTPCTAKPAWEQELEQVKSSWGVCQDEVNRFCEGVQVGEGRIEKCLKDHRAKLSKKCRASQGLK